MRLRSSPATGGPVSSSSSACAVPVASITMCNGARMAPCSQIRRRALLLRHPSCRGVSVTTRLAVHGWEVASPLPRTFIQDGRSRPEVCAAAFNAGDAGEVQVGCRDAWCHGISLGRSGPVSVQYSCCMVPCRDCPQILVVVIRVRRLRKWQRCWHRHGFCSWRRPRRQGSGS